MEPSITSSPTAIERPPSSVGIDVELHGNRVAVDAGQHLGEPVTLGVATVPRRR